jgi:hypothetical protein
MLRNKINSTLLETLVMLVSIELFGKKNFRFETFFLDLKLIEVKGIERKKTIRKSDSNWVN